MRLPNLINPSPRELALAIHKLASLLTYVATGKVLGRSSAGAGEVEQVTPSGAADMAAWTVKIRNAATTGAPSDAALAGFITEATPAAGDFLIGFLATGELRKFAIGALPGGGGAPGGPYTPSYHILGF